MGAEASKMNQIPAVRDFTPAPRVHRQSAPRPLKSIDFFRAGFYGGLGLWCAFLLINVAFFLGALALLLALGVISAAAVSL